MNGQITSLRASPYAGCGVGTSPARRCSRGCLGLRRLSAHRIPSAALRFRTPCARHGHWDSTACPCVAAGLYTTQNYTGSVLTSSQHMNQAHGCSNRRQNRTCTDLSLSQPMAGGACSWGVPLHCRSCAAVRAGRASRPPDGRDGRAWVAARLPQRVCTHSNASLSPN